MTTFTQPEMNAQTHTHMNTQKTWSAPKSSRHLGAWHIIKLENGLFEAGHFALTGHGEALDYRVNRIPTGRTAGRALRAFRRKLKQDPVAF